MFVIFTDGEIVLTPVVPKPVSVYNVVAVEPSHFSITAVTTPSNAVVTFAVRLFKICILLKFGDKSIV